MEMHQGSLHPLLPSFQSILLNHQFVLGTEAGDLLHVVSALVALPFQEDFDVINQYMSKTISAHVRGDENKGHVTQSAGEVHRVLQGGKKDHSK